MRNVGLVPRDPGQRPDIASFPSKNGAASGGPNEAAFAGFSKSRTWLPRSITCSTSKTTRTGSSSNGNVPTQTAARGAPSLTRRASRGWSTVGANRWKPDASARESPADPEKSPLANAYAQAIPTVRGGDKEDGARLKDLCQSSPVLFSPFLFPSLFFPP